MSKTHLPAAARESFESLKQSNAHGAEYWGARKLQPLLGYSQWRRFEQAIERAVTSCETSGNNPANHFAGAGKMVGLVSGSQRQVEDYHLSRVAGTLVVDKEWNSARKTRPLKTVSTTLAEMTGPRERCMYWCDSHGTDIEHFWPKADHPERMFRWPNLLLSCTECGRFKGRQFPVENGETRLVDPTAENPWQFLDFDPEVGVLVARYDMASKAENPKSVETVKVLQLDRREALNDGYRKTWQRLVVAVESALQQPLRNAGRLTRTLRAADDHGLLGWCFAGTGQRVAPFSTLRNRCPDAWATCVHAFA